MCCIFTWLAWCFDASHRLVVFIMACLISTSFCCLLLTASLAGVAMGYNYSLAEYIDLKETNISVYIKRGVYDDEISDDFDWRRSGKDSDISYKDAGGLRAGGQPIVEGRRRESSIFESEGENKYEGSLMRLTSSPNPLAMQRFQPEPPYTTPRTTANVVDGLLAVADSLPGGSMDRLKAIQAAARYHEAKRVELATAKFPEDASARVKAIEENAQIHDARRMDASTTTDKYDKYFKQLARYPGFPGSDVAARRFDDARQKDLRQSPTTSDKFRDAVFGGQLAGWPTRAITKATTANFYEYEVNVDPFAHTAGKPAQSARTWESARRNFEDTQKSDYDDSGLPSRRKRSHDKIALEKKLLNDIEIFINKLDTLNDQIHKPLVEELISNNTGDNDTTQAKPDNNPSVKGNEEATETNNNTSVKIIEEATETKSDLENVKYKNIHPLYDTNENNRNVVFKEFIRKYLEHLTSFGDMERKDQTNSRKRRRSTGYEYKILGNKQTKSFWWRIVNGAQKQWSRVTMYEDKLISQITDMTAVLKEQLKGKIVT